MCLLGSMEGHYTKLGFALILRGLTVQQLLSLLALLCVLLQPINVTTSSSSTTGRGNRDLFNALPLSVLGDNEIFYCLDLCWGVRFVYAFGGGSDVAQHKPREGSLTTTFARLHAYCRTINI